MLGGKDDEVKLKKWAGLECQGPWFNERSFVLVLRAMGIL